MTTIIVLWLALSHIQPYQWNGAEFYDTMEECRQARDWVNGARKESPRSNYVALCLPWGVTPTGGRY
jgi:hypothetical protein